MKFAPLLTAAALLLAAPAAMADPFADAHAKCLSNPEVLTCTALVESETIAAFAARSNADLGTVIQLNEWQSVDPATVIPPLHYFQFGQPSAS